MRLVDTRRHHDTQIRHLDRDHLPGRWQGPANRDRAERPTAPDATTGTRRKGSEPSAETGLRSPSRASRRQPLNWARDNP